MSKCLPDREEREGHFMCGNNTHQHGAVDKDFECGQLLGEAYERSVNR